ncbi:MinD/ParA family protein [Oceanobacillus halotolerans]|uniref:MinD/ParA family protein n=1 Tax=Oceanobacillus halotolerans TaxID=2663380 RepID=UPI001CF7C9C5|nr:MinD/ParA family protein [Oceanobacillus halotolerans]
MKKGKTISVVSGKGGVGKSNVALNFALELIQYKKKVLIFDLDVGMGNIDILLGLQAEQTIVDMFTKQLSIYDIIESGPKGLSYIAAGTGLTNFFALDQTKIDYFFQQYDQLIEVYDYIIFDMGAGITQDSLLFIMASDECFVVTTPEPTSITDAYSMVKHILNNKKNMPIYIIMNRTPSLKDGKKALERFQRVVSQFLGVTIHMMGVLPDDKVVTNAVMRQIPFTLLNDHAMVSKAIRQVTRNYITDTSDANKQDPFTFVQKLKHFIKR